MAQVADKIAAWSFEARSLEFLREERLEIIWRNKAREVAHDYARDRPRSPKQISTNRPSPFINELFQCYVREWTSKSRHLSSIKRMVALPSYRHIINLGPGVVPLLLKELRDRPNFWFPALRELTGQKEIGKDRDFDEACKAWIAWGEANGHLH